MIGLTYPARAHDPIVECPTDSKECYAKLDNGLEPYTFIFYVKADKNGATFDPWGVYSAEARDRFDAVRGRNDFDFVRVSQTCFDYYIKFLQTRNKSFKLNADRER